MTFDNITQKKILADIPFFFFTNDFITLAILSKDIYLQWAKWTSQTFNFQSYLDRKHIFGETGPLNPEKTVSVTFVF